MNYTFMVGLSGRICEECTEPLSEITVLLYEKTDEFIANLAAAVPKNTYKKLSKEEVDQKKSLLLAKGTTDNSGKVELHLDKKYDGKAFDVDIVLTNEENGEEFHFHLSTLAPSWRQAEKGYLAGWNHVLPNRVWCYLNSQIDRWIICGKLIHCKTQEPIGGVLVSAFDRDWLQDDELGTALTGADGRFFIVYKRSDFTPGTWIDVELTGGPDVYFHVNHPSGAPLLIEPAEKGREAGRENIGPCFCITLCLEDFEQEDEEFPPPVFTHVGHYNHQTDIDSSPGSSGLTISDNRAFYQSIRLNGTLPKKFQGGQMEYRFFKKEVQADGTSITGFTPVNMSQIGRTVIGQLIKYAPTFPGDPNPFKSTPYTVNGNPGELEANEVGGWIQVPQQSSSLGIEGYFQPNGNQIVLATIALGGWTDTDLTGLKAGDSSTSTGKPLALNRYFTLQMRVRKVGDPGSEEVAGVCEQIAINNSLYDNILRHPSWMPQNLSNQLSVTMVDIEELVVGGGCAGIENDLGVKFTAAHPTIGNVTIRMTGPGGPYSFTLPAPPIVPGELFGVATPSGFVVGDLKPCAYIVSLRVQLLLTTGDHIPDDQWDQIAFCKS